MIFTEEEKDYLLFYEKTYCSEKLTENQKKSIIKIRRKPIDDEELLDKLYEFFEKSRESTITESKDSRLV